MKKKARTTLSKLRARNILSRFPSASLIVVGDAMLDEYYWGTVERISPEAPVPIVRIESATLKLGGAANVASNIGTTGITPHLVALCGDDTDGDRLRNLIHEMNISSEGLFVSKNRRTTLKTRIMAQHQQMIRADRESYAPPDENELHLLINHINSLLPDVQAVIVSDYGKGLMSRDFLRTIIDTCRSESIFVAVDPKIRDLSDYHGANMMTPNLRETQQLLGLPLRDRSIEEIKELGWQLIAKAGVDLLLITLGERGMAIFETADASCTHLPTVARKVYDVTGAGDTVISVFTAAIACGATPLESAILANHAAGLAVAELGTATVDAKGLLRQCIQERKSGGALKKRRRLSIKQ